MSAASPAVSVVMATYNRSNIIGFSIQSLLRSTFADWELIVVGDACTDDTEAVVSGFSDQRIRFVNLAVNCGEQSGPNNEGVRLARGRAIAFLNHDDLWFPGHLAKSLAMLDSDPTTDLVFGLGLAFETDGAAPVLVGATSRDGRYHTGMRIPATLWILRRELADRIGSWSPAGTIRAAPSQDWLHRCHRAGARMVGSQQPAAVIISSGSRKDSYRLRQQQTHARLAARMQEPDFAAVAILQAALPWEDARATLYPGAFFAEAFRLSGRRVFDLLGLFPPAPHYWLRHWRKGSFVRALRRNRGLPPQP